jgi:hypothetical protein
MVQTLDSVFDTRLLLIIDKATCGWLKIANITQLFTFKIVYI